MSEDDTRTKKIPWHYAMAKMDAFKSPASLTSEAAYIRHFFIIVRLKPRQLSTHRFDKQGLPSL